MSSGCSQKYQKRVGDACPEGALTNSLKKQVGDACPQGAFKHRKKNGGGRMS
jgi:uncharacterized Fe-S cluster protein YjdI